MCTPGLTSIIILSLEPSGTNVSASIAAVSGLRTTDLWEATFSVRKYLRHNSMGGNSPGGTSGRTSPRRGAFPFFGSTGLFSFFGFGFSFLVFRVLFVFTACSESASSSCFEDWVKVRAPLWSPALGNVSKWKRRVLLLNTRLHNPVFRNRGNLVMYEGNVIFCF